MLVRYTGDTLAFSPPLIAEPVHLDRIAEAVSSALRSVG